MQGHRRSAVVEFQAVTAAQYQARTGKPPEGYGPRQKAPRRPYCRPEDAKPPAHVHPYAGPPLPRDTLRLVMPLRLVEWSNGRYHWECACGWEGGDFKCKPKRWDVGTLQRANDAAAETTETDPKLISASLWGILMGERVTVA